jgi:cytoskeletal protein RodZ
MTNNMNNRQVRRNSDKARAITKAKARKTNILLSVGALALVAVIAASAFAFGIFNNNNNVKTATTTPTTISMKANENKAAQAVKQEAQTATQAEQAEVKQTTTQPAAQTTAQTTVQPAQNVAEQAQAVQTNTQNTQSAQEAKKSEDKIETVNGERVYIDTKRTAPEKTGTPAHYYANGKTSYGFDWDYSGGGNFLLRCDYNFDQHQYDFQFYGVTPGTATTTLYYFTDDNVKVPVTLTFNVDNDLNVSIG